MNKSYKEMKSKIIQADWLNYGPQLSAIRSQVFIDEQGVSESEEWDGLDNHAIHFLAIISAETLSQNQQIVFDSTCVGCARILNEKDNNRFHIGRVAILKPYRNQGLGTMLMQQLINYCKSTVPHQEVYLDAQIQRRSFYEALGFIAIGDHFMDAGIVHIRMVLEQN